MDIGEDQAEVWVHLAGSLAHLFGAEAEWPVGIIMRPPPPDIHVCRV